MRRWWLLLSCGLMLIGCGPAGPTQRPEEGAWVRISAGGRHTCAVQRDGSLWCWGGNEYGQVGDGSRTDRTVPVRVQLPEGVETVACGRDHTCALLEGGGLHCWGRNQFGQLGDGTLTDRANPGSVVGLFGLDAVDASDRHTCAVESGGRVWCWGSNRTGQLGIGDAVGPDRCGSDPPTACAMTPQQVSDVTDVVAVGAGGDEEVAHTCALTNLNRLWCWGGNDERQLGDGTLISRNSPVEMSELVGILAMDTGSAHTCAVLMDGTSYCWGRDYGDPFYISVLADVARVTAGVDYRCATLGDGSLHCWGANDFGQLGDGSQNDRIVPTPVVGLDGVVSASAGEDHTCAVDGDGDAWCWGSNAEGQLGGSSMLYSWTPVKVGG